MKDQKPVQIFSNFNENIGVNVIKSPVKLTILEMLRDSDLEFDEIVSNIGKSKSTVSVHLKSLRESGIISYRVHPIDNRKKIFYLNSKYLGSVNITEPKEIKETQADYLVENLVDEDAEFSTLLFHTLKSMLIQEGINIDPILQSTGNSIGKSIFDKLYDDDLDVFMPRKDYEILYAKWKEIADEYYDKIMKYDEDIQLDDHYYSSDDLHTFVSNMKTSWEKYNKEQCENYVKALEAIYQGGSIIGPIAASYECEMQKEWALQLVRLYSHL